MIITRNEKHMFHLRIFRYFGLHDFHSRTSIRDYAINSSQLIIDCFYTSLYHSVSLNDCTHFFSYFDRCFQMKFFI